MPHIASFGQKKLRAIEDEGVFLKFRQKYLHLFDFAAYIINAIDVFSNINHLRNVAPSQKR